jgi:hypothetical protein
MPAQVEKAFARGVSALFADADTKKPDAPKNVFSVWNGFASKFPKLYQFAEFSRRARATEEKLLLLHKLDPRSEADRGKLADMFITHLEHDVSNTLEGALENLWKELSQ